MCEDVNRRMWPYLRHSSMRSSIWLATEPRATNKMKPLRNLTMALTLIITLLAVTLPAMADDNQLSPGIEDRCKSWTRYSESWRKCVNDELEARPSPGP